MTMPVSKLISTLSARLVASVLLCGVAQATVASDCAQPSAFGPEDQVGNLNFITPEKTRQASKLITTGKSYSLAIETSRDTPAFGGRNFSITVLQPDQLAGPIGPKKLSYNDDLITGWAGVGTQIDGLGHVGTDGVYFNCHQAADFVKANGLKKLGIETLPPIATRGVVLDMTGLLGINPVKEGTAFNQPEIAAAMKRQGIESIGAGDVVLFHTGWTSLIGKDDQRYVSAEPGLGLGGARYLASLNVAAVGADNWGVEVVPFEEGSGPFEVHQRLLAKHGIFLLENINTSDLVTDQAWEFFFTLGPARISGAVQAIANPIAIR